MFLSIFGFKGLLLSLAIASAAAHPGEKHSVLVREAAAHQSAVAHAQRSLNLNAGNEAVVALKSRAGFRRAKLSAVVREKRGIKHSKLHQYHKLCVLY